VSDIRHPLIIDFEEHFQLASTGRRVPERHWPQLPSRIARNADRALRALDRHGARATFFVSAWNAERHGPLIAAIAREGHEIACRFGRIGRTAGEDRDDRHDAVAGLKRALEAAGGRVVHGCRVAAGGSSPHEMAAMGAAGFRYGVVNGPPAVLAGAAAEPRAPALLPMRSLRIAGQDWPRASGMILRQLPDRLAARFTGRWARSPAPRPFACALWEFDPDLPELAVLTPLQRRLSYRNLQSFGERFARLLDGARFVPVRDHFGLADQPAQASAPAARAPDLRRRSGQAGAPVSLVVPCFNEEEGLAYLANVLADLDADLGRRHPLSVVLVDDGSTDGTWAEMERLFGGDARFRLIRHDRNRGIGAAILTGVSAATTEIVAVIDSDCSYDPARIEEMLPLLAPDVALVTASPYHADGGVEGVPEWRLILSRGASRLYRLVLRNKLATYTSCFRVCRKSALTGLALQHEGYIGVVEMLARLDLAGWRIAEHPVVLEARLLGHSKLRILRVIAGHLRFLGEICVTRLLDRGRAEVVKGTR
jgi:hypothetical protein